MTPAPGRLPVEVVIPLRWDDDRPDGRVDELAAYLAGLARVADVTVVDGSDPVAFAGHAAAWGRAVRHLAPDPVPGLNGKVVGAVTGVRAARHEHVVLADDDVRYDATTLQEVARRLDHADLVRPQNCWTSWPWQARWDGARSLLNWGVAADWPGTFAVRRSVVVRTGGWDADVLFENLQLVRTVRAVGGRVVDAPEVRVRRLPPTVGVFVEQRVRQAYDDIAQPWRLAAALATWPLLVAGLRRRPGAVLAAALALVLTAERGRRRGGGPSPVPRDVPLWAPLWVLERGACSWVALVHLALGGVPYRGRRIVVPARPSWQVRRRLGGALRA